MSMTTLPDDVVHLHGERTERISAVHNDVDHYYIVDDKKWKVSVTTYINEVLFEKFNEDQVIYKMMSSRNWPESKYYGMTSDAIKLQWEQIRTEASQLGLAMHTNLENYYHLMDFKDKCHLVLMAAYKDPDCAFSKLPLFLLKAILLQYKKTLDKVYRNNKEFSLFSRFLVDYPNLVHYHIEWRIFEEETRFAGSVDMVYRDPERPNKFLIYDWKRSKEIKESNPWQRGRIPATAHLPDSNYWHFSLQLNIYKYILEKAYKMQISEMYILVLHPKQENYMRIAIPDLGKEVNDIVAYRKRQLNAKTQKRKIETFYPPNKKICIQ